MARHVPSLQPTAARLFSLGSETRLRPLFEQAGFQEVAVMPHPHRFPMPSFEAYFEQFERGWGLPGQTFQSLPEETRRAVCEETRRSIGDTGGPIEVEVEMMFAGGRK
jgi:hypothetical protein